MRLKNLIKTTRQAKNREEKLIYRTAILAFAFLLFLAPTAAIDINSSGPLQYYGGGDLDFEVGANGDVNFQQGSLSQIGGLVGCANNEILLGNGNCGQNLALPSAGLTQYDVSGDFGLGLDYANLNDLESGGNVVHSLNDARNDGGVITQDNEIMIFDKASDTWNSLEWRDENNNELWHVGTQSDNRFYIYDQSTNEYIFEIQPGGNVDIQNRNLDMNNNQLDSVNQLNFNGGAYIDEGTADYGSIRLDGGESSGYGGIRVQGNRDIVVGMTDSDGTGFSTGAYDDSNNNWIWRYDGSSTGLRYNGGTKLKTESYGVSVNTDGTNNNDGYRLDGNAALTTSGSWLRLNTDSNWNDRIYTPSVFRADGEIRTRGGMQVQGSDRHSYNGISSSTSNSGHLMLDSNGGNLYLNWDEPNGDIRMQGNKVRVDSFLDMNGNRIENVATANVDYVSSVGSAQDIRFNDGNDIVFRNADNNDVARVDHDERALKVNDNSGFQLPVGEDAY